MPLVSVIMPAYNAAATIASAIDSVKRQTIEDWELLVVDDWSRDKTAQIIEDYSRLDRRIRVLRTERNSGSPAIPRNVATRAASGRYIAFLDADDVWLPQKLERQTQAMRDANAVLCCSGYTVIDQFGQQIGSFVPPRRAEYRELLKRNTIGCLTVVYDTKRFGKREFPHCGHEDYALWLDMLREGESALGLPEKLASYRLMPGSVSSDKLKVARFFWHIYRERENFGLVLSAYMCMRYALLNRSKYS
jgi:teichuronic acid biosynthesis glycosyltransferase TuaG